MASCNKTELVENPASQDEYSYTFVIGNNDTPALTKATFGTEDGKRFLSWEDGDKVGAYALASGGNSYNQECNVAVSGEDFTINVKSTQPLTEGDKVYAYFPYYADKKTASTAVIHIAATQVQKPTGFVANAMPMAAEPYTMQSGEDLSKDANNTYTGPVGRIVFANLGSLINFKVFSTKGNTEKIESVKLIANKDEGDNPVYIGGNYTLDLTAVDFSDEETLKLSGAGTETEIITNLTTSVVPGTTKDNAVDVCMIVAPVTFSGSVVVTTDGHTYTFSMSEKTFARSRSKSLGLDLDKATVGELVPEEVWEPVTSTSDFIAGETYLILSTDASKYLPNTETSNAPVSQDVAVSAKGNIVASDAMKFVAKSVDGKSGFALESVSASGKYLTATASTANSVKINTTETTWTISSKTVNGGTHYLLTMNNGGRFLGLYTNGTWRYYAHENDKLNNDDNILGAVLYHVVDNRTTLDTPVLEVEGTLVTWDAIANADHYAVTIDGNAHNVNDTGIDLDDLSLVDGIYSVSVVAVPANTAQYKNSEAATTTVKVGTPALGKPSISLFTQTRTGFEAAIASEIENATSYSWTLYEGSVSEDDSNVVGMGTADALAFTSTINDSDYLIDAFTVGTTYYLVVTASATGFASTNSDPASFVAENIEAEKGTEENPYTASEAIAKAETLGDSTIENVYVTGIVSKTGTVNTKYNSVTYYISDDGSTSNQFEVYGGLYKDGANFTDANNVKLGDYVVVCGTLKYFSNNNNSQAEFDVNSQIKDILRAPTFNPDGGSFTEASQSVTISAESGAEIRYTTGETLPTSTTGTVYSGAISISETTTINALAVKDGKVTGVVSKKFTKGDNTDYSTIYTTSNDVTATVSSGGTNYKVSIGGTSYDAVKANKAATFTIGVPSGTNTIHLFIAAWNGEGSTVTVTGGTMNNASITADSGISGSVTTYTLSGTPSSYYRTISVNNNTTSVTIKLASNKRAVIWGINAD